MDDLINIPHDFPPSDLHCSVIWAVPAPSSAAGEDFSGLAWPTPDAFRVGVMDDLGLESPGIGLVTRPLLATLSNRDVTMTSRVFVWKSRTPALPGVKSAGDCKCILAWVRARAPLEYARVRAFMRVYVYVYVHVKFVWVCVCMYVCMCMCMRVCVCLRVLCVYVYACACVSACCECYFFLWVYVPECLCMFMGFVFVYWFIRVGVRLCAVSLCVCTCLCMFVCVFVSLHAS